MRDISVLREKLLASGALSGRVECSYECYLLKKPVYLILLNRTIGKSDMAGLCETIIHDINVRYKKNFAYRQQIIIMADTTDDRFGLTGMAGRVNYPPYIGIIPRETVFSFYLINENDQKTYHELWMAPVRMPRRIRMIKAAVEEYLQWVKEQQEP